MSQKFKPVLKKKNDKDKTYRGWCFTYHLEFSSIIGIELNCEIKKEVEMVNNKLKIQSIKYAVFQLEQCPTSKKYHLQGYLELVNPNRLSWMKQLITSKTHWEPRLGTREQARDYCMKKESKVQNFDIIEIGTFASKQGKRNDIVALIDACKDPSKSNFDICNDQELAVTAFKYKNSFLYFKNMYQLKNINKWRELEVTIFFGYAGTGKSRKVYSLHQNLFKLDRPSGNTVWWDGYELEDVLLIDDFYGWIPHGFYLNVTDGYPLKLDVKHSHTYANFTKIYITSNKNPSKWYKSGWIPQMDRRHHKIYEYKKNGEIKIWKDENLNLMTIKDNDNDCSSSDEEII